MTESSEFNQKDQEFLEELEQLIGTENAPEDLSFFHGKKVMITGNTGFKGSWLTIWLLELGATVIGYSLEPPTYPSLYELAGLGEKITQIHGDVRNANDVRQAMEEHQPEILFHFAAQPIVLNSYQEPLITFETNVLGTMNVLEGIRNTPSLRSAVLATSDKCYENRESIWGYREIDRLGGSDPYSASKAMAELGIQSYIESFFQKEKTAIASVRSGNVLGGGDFTPHRLIPDCIKALQVNVPINVRNPKSVRSWIYVLDALYGYLLLAKKLFIEGTILSGPWNFGPRMDEVATVSDIVEAVVEIWGTGDWMVSNEIESPKETELLRLNSDKAILFLGWSPSTSLGAALEETVMWFQEYADNEEMFEVCLEQIDRFHSGIATESFLLE